MEGMIKSVELLRNISASQNDAVQQMRNRLFGTAELLANAMTLTTSAGKMNRAGVKSFANSIYETAAPMQAIANGYQASLGGLGLSDFIISNTSELVLGAARMAELISMSVQTPLVKTFGRAIGNLDPGICLEALGNTLNQPSILSSDLAFLRTAEIGKDLVGQIDMPTSVSKALAEMNLLTARNLISEEGISFHVQNGRYVNTSAERFDDDHAEISEQSTASSSQLNFIAYCQSTIKRSSEEEQIVSAKELMDFMCFLEKQRTLALEHGTGRKIRAWIQDLWNSGELTIDFDREIYYHTRARDESRAPYVMSEMMSAPSGVPGAGRYNYPGQPHYYFADTQDGANLEVKRHHRGEANIVMQTIKLRPRGSARFLDLSGTMRHGKDFLKYLRYDVENIGSSMPREYFIPCFVSDCCRMVGFDGIKYYGGKDYRNYVLWSNIEFDYVDMMQGKIDS